MERLKQSHGDIHNALEDATGNNVGTVSAEIPVGPRWCEIRQTVFAWTTQKFPFSVKTAYALKIREPRVITVTGKAALSQYALSLFALVVIVADSTSSVSFSRCRSSASC